MIDADILKQLGWSDELIAQVTRTANDLRMVSPNIPQPSQVQSINPTTSSAAIEPVQSTDTTYSVIARK